MVQTVRYKRTLKFESVILKVRMFLHSAVCLWQHTALEDVLGQFFTPRLQCVESSSNQRHNVVTVFIDNAQLQRLQCLRLRGSET